MDRIFAFSVKSLGGILIVLVVMSLGHYGLSFLNIGIYSSSFVSSAYTVTTSATRWLLDALTWIAGMMPASTPTAPAIPAGDGPVGRFE